MTYPVRLVVNPTALPDCDWCGRLISAPHRSCAAQMSRMKAKRAGELLRSWGVTDDAVNILFKRFRLTGIEQMLTAIGFHWSPVSRQWVGASQP